MQIKIIFPIGTSSNIKLKAEIDGVSSDQCDEVYRKMDIVLSNKQFCAGGDESGKGSCKGMHMYKCEEVSCLH